MEVKTRQCSTFSKVISNLQAELSSGKLGDEYDKDISFKLNVSQFRRRKILESLMGENKQKREKGSKILTNFKNQVLNNPQLK